MRNQVLILITALGLGAIASAVAPAVARASDAADSNQTATWAQRKLLRFSPPAVYVPENGYATRNHYLSCDQMIDRVRFVLEQLGARVDDMRVDDRDCRLGGTTIRSIDVMFSSLEPVDSTGRNITGPPLAVHWQTVTLSGADTGLGDCAFLKYASDRILPLFVTREVKLISPEVCAKVGVGLRAQVLKLSPSAAAAR